MDNPSNKKAIIELLYKMADDNLIIGHRNSEWNGLGPVLEEDIAFNSMAQDKVGHAYNLYNLLHDLGEEVPDKIAFLRNEKEFKCCHLVEHPIGEYDFSLIRHFLYDFAEMSRFEMLQNSSFKPLADLAKKFKSEVKYHIFHAGTWIRQLSKGNEESHSRLQTALNEAYPLALGIFEPGPFENELKSDKIFDGEKVLQEKWFEKISAILDEAGLILPDANTIEAAFGGRNGIHTEFLQPLLNEMTEVIRLENPEAEW